MPYLTKNKYGIYGLFLLNHWLLWGLNLYPDIFMLKWKEKWWTTTENQSTMSRFWMWSKHYTNWISPTGIGFLLFSLATPHSHVIHSRPLLPHSKVLLLSCQNDLTLTFVNSLGLLCVYISHQSLSPCGWWKLLPC